MSRIFDALRRSPGENDAMLTVFAPNDRHASSGAATPAAETSPASPKAPEHLTAEGSEYRVESLRLSSAAPTLPFDGSSSRAAEQYRLIRTRILHHPRAPRVLLLSSPTPGDGKTISAVNLAVAISLKNDNTVLLIDGDLRRPCVANMLGIPAKPGLADVLEGVSSLENAIVRIQEVPGLYVLPAGRATVTPTELLDSARWKDALATMRGAFRWVVVDCPPAHSVADYELLEQVADGVIIVVRPDHTNRALTFKTLESIPKEKQLGLVINCTTDWFLFKPAHPYYYYADYK